MSVPNDQGAGTGRDAYLNPIRALLHGLDKKRSISVVAATTELKAGFDLEKIARYIEEIPKLPDDVVLKVLNTFREGCLKEKEFIGPTPGEAFRPWQDTYSGRGLDLPVPESFLVLEQGLVVLNSTGRKLKQGLRLCYEKWENLRGEINFEDLLFMCSLKVAKPKIFAIVKDKRTVLSDKEVMQFFWRIRESCGWNHAGRVAVAG